MPATAADFEILFFCSFFVFFYFQNLQSNCHNLAPKMTVPDATKCQPPLQISKIKKNELCKKKLQISQILMVCGRGVPNRLRPGDGRIPATATDFESFCSRFGHQLTEPQSSPPSLPDPPPLARRIVRG